MNKKISDYKIQINFSSDNQKKEYTKFLKQNPDSNIFHTIEWKEVLESYFDFDPFYLIARNNKNEIKAILPFFYLKNFCGKRLDSLPFSAFGGAVGDNKYVELLVKKIFEINEKLKCKYIIIRQHPMKFSNLYEKMGMKSIVNRWNQIIIIKNPEDLWRDLKKSNRNSINQALRHNVEVKCISNIEKISDFYELEFLTYKKFGEPRPDISFYKTLWKKMKSKGYVEFFIAKYRDITIASSMIFRFNKNVIYTYSNSNPKYLNLRPNNLILWKIIEWSYDKNYHFLDLGCTSLQNKGLFSFKSSFNTKNIPFAHYYYPSDSTLIKDTFLGKIGKKIYKKAPARLLKPIIPLIVKKLI